MICGHFEKLVAAEETVPPRWTDRYAVFLAPSWR